VGEGVWYYGRAVKREGPVDLETLITAIMVMDEPETVLVWKEGLPSWVQAGSLPEVASKMPPKLPPEANKDQHRTTGGDDSSADRGRVTPGQSGQRAGDRFWGPAKYPVVAFTFAALLLLWGLFGGIRLGPILAGLLYTAFGLALQRHDPLAQGRYWCLAAFPVVLTGAGMFLFVATIVLTARIRSESSRGLRLDRADRGSRSSREPREGVTKTCPQCGGRATFSRQAMPTSATVSYSVAMPGWFCKCGYFVAVRSQGRQSAA